MAVITPGALQLLSSVGLPAACASRFTLSMAVMVTCAREHGVGIEGRTVRIVFGEWEVLSNDVATTYRSRFGTYAPPFSMSIWQGERDVGALARGRTTICDENLITMLEDAYARCQARRRASLVAIEVLR